MKTFVLFGSTGDLATRYVLPALGALLQKGVYDHLICIGRRDWSRDDFRNFLAPYPDLLNHTETISYVKLDIEGGDFSPLRDAVGAQNIVPRAEDIQPLQNQITYHLCLSPEYFVTVAKGLASVGLNTPNSTIMIEKPFGHDLKTAIALNLDLQHIFDEDQIYRVDHYLGKNFVRELLEFRLSQGENWYSDRISEIQITARENIGIEDRGAYYDNSGATRDFLQNHLMQMLAIATMQTPHASQIASKEGVVVSKQDGDFDTEDIRDKIFMAISSVAPLLLDPRHDILMGQYLGYKETPGVRPDSRTETYIRTSLTIDNSHWMDTKVVLETGKALDRKESSVKILFRDGTEKVFQEDSSNKNNAYERLIEKAIARDASYFVRWDSVRAAWQVVDELLHCTDNCPILQVYTPGADKV